MEDDFAGRLLGANTFTLRRFPWFGNNTTRGRSGASGSGARASTTPTSALVRDALPAGTRYGDREPGERLARRTPYARPRQVEAHAVEGDYFTIKKYDLVQRPRLHAAGGRAGLAASSSSATRWRSTSSRTSTPIGRELRIGGHAVPGHRRDRAAGQRCSACRSTSWRSRRSTRRCTGSPTRAATSTALIVQAPNDLMMDEAMETVREVLRGHRRLRPGERRQLRAWRRRRRRSRSSTKIKSMMTHRRHRAPGHRPRRRRHGDHEHHARGGRRADARDRRSASRSARAARTSCASSSSRRRRSARSARCIGIALGIALAKVIAGTTPLPAGVAPWSLVVALAARRGRRHRLRRVPGAPRLAARPHRRPAAGVARCDSSTRILHGARGRRHRARRDARQQGARRPHDLGRRRRRLRRRRDGVDGARHQRVVPAATSTTFGADVVLGATAGHRGFNSCDGTDENCPERRNPAHHARRSGAPSSGCPTVEPRSAWLFGSGT